MESNTEVENAQLLNLDTPKQKTGQTNLQELTH